MQRSGLEYACINTCSVLFTNTLRYTLVTKTHITQAGCIWINPSSPWSVSACLGNSGMWCVGWYGTCALTDKIQDQNALVERFMPIRFLAHWEKITEWTNIDMPGENCNVNYQIKVGNLGFSGHEVLVLFPKLAALHRPGCLDTRCH